MEIRRGPRHVRPTPDPARPAPRDGPIPPGAAAGRRWSCTRRWTASSPSRSGRLPEATGSAVRRQVTTSESTKTVGLTQRIIAEAGAARGATSSGTTRSSTPSASSSKGLLAPVHPPHAADYPEDIPRPRTAPGTASPRGPASSWSTPSSSPRPTVPRGINDLTDPRWKGKIGLAKPLFGTTATHAACLFAAWGEEKAKAFFGALKANDVRICLGQQGGRRRRSARASWRSA